MTLDDLPAEDRAAIREGRYADVSRPTCERVWREGWTLAPLGWLARLDAPLEVRGPAAEPVYFAPTVAEAEALVAQGHPRRLIFTARELADLLAPVGPPTPSVADAMRLLVGSGPVDVRALPGLRAPEGQP